MKAPVFDDERVLIYCDPPYEQSTRTSARYEIDMEKTNKSKIIVSAYECDLYDILLNHGFKKHQFEINTQSGKMEPKTKIETLYYNY